MGYAHRLVGLALCIAGLLYIQPSAEARQTPLVGMDWLKRPDARLQKTYTVRAAHAYVGEILDELSRACGASLTADLGNDQAADFEITIFVKGCGLADIMEGLRSLFSQRGAEWQWLQDGPEGTYTYTLFRSVAARKLGAQLRAEIQDRFERDAQAEIDWLNASLDDRKRIEAEHPELANVMQGERLRGGMALFASHFTPEQRQAILRGGERPTLSLSDLTPSERSWLETIWTSSVPADQRKSQSLPERLFFFADMSEITPTLAIEIDRIGGYGYVGGMPLQRVVAGQMTEAWRTPGEEVAGALGAKSVPAKEKDPSIPNRPLTRDEIRAEARKRKPMRLENLLRDLADEAGVNLIADYRRSEINQAPEPTPYGKTVKEYCAMLEDYIVGIHYMAKVRDGLLLLRDRAWFRNSPEESLVPWKQLRSWRQEMRKNNGLITLDMLAQMFQLNRGQVIGLRGEFPEAGSAVNRGSLFAFWARLPVLSRRAAEKTGLSLSSISPDSLSLLAPPGRPLPEDLADSKLFVTAVPIILTDDGVTTRSGLRVEAMIQRPTKPALDSAFFSRQRSPEQMRSTILVEPTSSNK